MLSLQTLGTHDGEIPAGENLFAKLFARRRKAFRVDKVLAVRSRHSVTKKTFLNASKQYSL